MSGRMHALAPTGLRSCTETCTCLLAHTERLCMSEGAYARTCTYRTALLPGDMHVLASTGAQDCMVHPQAALTGRAVVESTSAHARRTCSTIRARPPLVMSAPELMPEILPTPNASSPHHHGHQHTAWVRCSCLPGAIICTYMQACRHTHTHTRAHTQQQQQQQRRRQQHAHLARRSHLHRPWRRHPDGACSCAHTGGG